MKMRNLFVVISSITLLLVAAGAAGAISNRVTSSPSAAAEAVSSGITYQGRLTRPNGMPRNGTFTMRFIVYDAEEAGSAVWDSGNLDIAVNEGLFTTKLGVDQASFNGQALWLSIIVDGQTLSPRQEILPAPYALSLRPGADIVGESIQPGDAVLAGYAPATGTALHANANGGAGVFGSSEENYGVWGSSANSWGGYFTSNDGYGLRVDTGGTDHFDHGAYVTSVSGYGVYAQSAQNQAVRGEAGNVTGASRPLGTVGVVGIGSNRGTYGSSVSGIGLYGVSQDNYGLWAQSANWRGATGRTSRSDNNYGFYTPDNLFSLNLHTTGSLMQVMQNSGAEPLSPGDVVVFSGIVRSAGALDGPIVQVSKTDTANSSAVAGVVFSRFNMAAIDPDLESPDHPTQANMAAIEVTPAGNAAPGEYVLIVVQGPAQVKASALGAGSIQPGDLLSTGATAGSAMRAATMSINDVETAIPGAVFAKALEPLDGTQDMIYVYVTLQ